MDQLISSKLLSVISLVLNGENNFAFTYPMNNRVCISVNILCKGELIGCAVWIIDMLPCLVPRGIFDQFPNNNFYGRLNSNSIYQFIYLLYVIFFVIEYNKLLLLLLKGRGNQQRQKGQWCVAAGKPLLPYPIWRFKSRQLRLLKAKIVTVVR